MENFLLPDVSPTMFHTTSQGGAPAMVSLQGFLPVYQSEAGGAVAASSSLSSTLNVFPSEATYSAPGGEGKGGGDEESTHHPHSSYYVITSPVSILSTPAVDDTLPVLPEEGTCCSLPETYETRMCKFDFYPPPLSQFILTFKSCHNEYVKKNEYNVNSFVFF